MSTPLQWGTSITRLLHLGNGFGWEKCNPCLKNILYTNDMNYTYLKDIYIWYVCILCWYKLIAWNIVFPSTYVHQMGSSALRGGSNKRHVCHTFIFRPCSTTILQQDNAIVKGEEHVDIWALLLMSFSRAIARFHNGCWKKPDVKLLTTKLSMNRWAHKIVKSCIIMM